MKNYTLLYSQNGTLHIKQNIQLKEVYQELIKIPSTPTNTKNILLYQLFNENKILNSYDQYIIQDNIIQLYNTGTPINRIIPTITEQTYTEPIYTGIEKEPIFNIGTYQKGITATKKIGTIIKYLTSINKYDLKKYFVNIQDNYYSIQKKSNIEYILTNTETTEKQEIKEIKRTKTIQKYTLQ